jgi:hypothetical protein
MPSTGWVTVTLGGQDSSANGGGTNTWSAPERITAEDGSSTICNGVSPEATTRFLRGSGADLSAIPNGATLQGIRCRVKGHEGSGLASITQVYLRTNTTSEVNNSNNLAATPQFLPTTSGFVTFGSTSSLSGYGGNVAAVKASGFGFVVQVTNGHPAADLSPRADVFQVEVTWIDPVSPPVVTNNSASGLSGIGGTLQMTATNTPTSWSLPGSPPAGVTIHSSGLISWTSATPPGVYSITVRATNAGGSGDGTFFLTLIALTPRRRNLGPGTRVGP